MQRLEAKTKFGPVFVKSRFKCIEGWCRYHFLGKGVPCVGRSKGQEVLPHNVGCPLFLQSLVVTSGDVVVKLDIFCIHSVYTCDVFE